VLIVIVTMVVILLVSGLIAAYVAFPHRGAPIPMARPLGEAMSRVIDALPLLGNTGRTPLRR
jgi:hypothetical protein